MSTETELSMDLSPTERTIKDIFPVRPIFDKEMTIDERKLHEYQKCANFDSRCKFCVGGRGRRRFHRQKGFQFVSLEQEPEHQHDLKPEGASCRPLRDREPAQYTLHEVDIDFTTITKNLIECMTMIDRETSHGFSFAVPNRTNTQYTAKKLHLELRRIGRIDRLRLKSDGDKGIRKIVESVGKLRADVGFETIPKLSIPYEHQSNGAAESMNNVIEGLATSILLRLEEKCKRAIAPECRFLLWLPEYASRVRTIYKNGGIIHRKLFGCEFSLTLGNIGEKVMYLREQNPKRREKFTAKYAPGIYLGLHEDWNRHVFYDLEFKKAIASSSYTQGQFEHTEQWDASAIEDIKALPWLWDTTTYDHEQLPHVKMDDPCDRDSETHEYGDMMGFDHQEGRRKTSFRVTRELIREFGKTSGCKGCQYLGCTWRIPRCHDKECHQRIFHSLIRKHTLEGAKKLRITSTDWHERIKHLEIILSNEESDSVMYDDIPIGDSVVPHDDEDLLQIEAREDEDASLQDQISNSGSDLDDEQQHDKEDLLDHIEERSDFDTGIPNPSQRLDPEFSDSEPLEARLPDDDTTLLQLLDDNKRSEAPEGCDVEPDHKRIRLDKCSSIREQNLATKWEVIKSEMENPWKDLDWSQLEPVKPTVGRVRIIQTKKGYDWNDSRPCNKVLLAQVRKAKQEEEESLAVHLQGITKGSSMRRIVDWGRLNTGEWEKMLGAAEDWIAEDHIRNLDYYDDNTGLPLEKQKVLLAREEQLVGLCKKNTWIMCDLDDAKNDPTWGKPPLGVRWVDIDKPGRGYRSRLVAKDFNRGSSLLERAEFYYPTIPIEIYKVLLTVAAGRQRTHLPRAQQYAVQILDISKAYSYSTPKRTVYIKLPPEVNPDGKRCGKLLKTLEGCRDGPRIGGKNSQTPSMHVDLFAPNHCPVCFTTQTGSVGSPHIQMTSSV